jgi:hypothetical protein
MYSGGKYPLRVSRWVSSLSRVYSKCGAHISLISKEIFKGGSILITVYGSSLMNLHVHEYTPEFRFP